MTEDRIGVQHRPEQAPTVGLDDAGRVCPLDARQLSQESQSAYARGSVRLTRPCGDADGAKSAAVERGTTQREDDHTREQGERHRSASRSGPQRKPTRLSPPQIPSRVLSPQNPHGIAQREQ